MIFKLMRLFCARIGTPLRLVYGASHEEESIDSNMVVFPFSIRVSHLKCLSPPIMRTVGCRAKASTLNHSSSIGITDWSRFYDDETHGFNSVSRHISRKINLVLESLRLLAKQSSINFCAITQLFRWCRKVSQKLIASASRRWFFSVFCYSQSQLVW